MKRFLLLLALSSQLLAPFALRAEMPIDDAQLTGTANQVKTGATLTVQSGATLTVATGGTLTVPASTFAIAATSGLQAALDAKAASASLGGAASLNVGTATGTVAAGDDPRIVGALQGIDAALLYQRLNDPIADAQLSANVPLLSAANTFTGALTAPAYHLPSFTVDTISPGTSGLGWADGRVTLQTPVGALQFYETGSPLTPVIYWPGKIVVGSMESTSITGTVDAALISSTGLTVIHDDIMRNSLNYPLRNWANGETYAGASGIPYVADAQGPSGGSNEATDGVYFPQTVVTGQATITSIMAGRYRTATQFKADLAITTADVSGLGSAATTAASAYEVAGAAAAAQSAAIAASQPRAIARLITTSDALLSTDTVILCTGAGGITLTLPAANAATPRPVQLEIINRTAGTITLARAGSDLFEGDTSALITAGSSWSITSDASANWYLY